ncbi:hypothetical protein [Neomicrococcus lactis]|uniref:hypothetical protein n=1 Tax=Neomicrococcus lactis TaxID=732241 RepID=UPI002300AD53|nr:hypothetical protein [Neomicrococcus lactis]
MSKSTLQPAALEILHPKHPEWCSHVECEHFTAWASVVHRGRPRFLNLEPVVGDWESNAATVRSTLQRIECEDGFASSVVELSIMSESGGLELDPERMRKLADWLNAAADYFEVQK